MAYTQNIDETTPAGSDDAKTADDQIRALKRDIKERLNSFFIDANADPLRIKDLLVLTGTTGVYIESIIGGGPQTGLIGANATQILMNLGSRPIKLPQLGVLPAGGSSMNNCIVMDASTGELIIYANNLRYRVTGVTAF
jgi:hypothetical protein